MARLESQGRHRATAVVVALFVSQPLFALTPRARGGQEAGRPTTELVRTCSPSVVTIVTKTSIGSGVIVHAQGVIATNLHVIRGAEQAAVRLANGDTYDDVTVIDVDARKDLALLKIKAFGLRPAVFGNSGRIEVGERVIAIGTPQGLETTVSEGIVSAIRDTGEGYRVFQTTAPASPGSSGGGLFSARGELVGLVTFKLKSGENLNFAVPTNYVRGMLSTASTMSLAELAAKYPATEKAEPEETDPSEAPGTSGLAAALDGRWLTPRGTSTLMVERKDDTLRVGWNDRRGSGYATAVARWDAKKALFSGVAQGRLPCTCGQQPRLERVCEASGVPVEIQVLSEGVLRTRLYQPHSSSCQDLSFKGGLFEHPGSWSETVFGR